MIRKMWTAAELEATEPSDVDAIFEDSIILDPADAPQELLAEGDRSVSDTVHSVGYRSATQFSREYARTFGTSPRDTARLASAQA